MTNKRLPIVGHPHLALAAQDDEILQTKILAGLRKAGFTVEKERLVPPDGNDDRSIIRAITEAFQTAKGA